MPERKRKRNAASANDPMSEAAAVLASARSRRRERCHHHTCYDHANLALWLTQELPDGWTVQQPPPLDLADGSTISAPSMFPVENDAAAQEAVAALLSATPNLDAADLIDGHCETVAAVTAEYFLDEIRAQSGVAPASGIALAAYSRLAADLQSKDVVGQVRLLFGPQKRAEGAPRRSVMWATLYPDVVAATLPRDGEDFLAEMCAGTRVDFGARFKAGLLAGAPFALPLYVLNYIWDGDELTAAELKAHVETACYSVHAIGLVFDPAQRVAYFADPNGPLLQGGSMEFLSVPFRKFGRGFKPTTALSQWDRDESKRLKAL
eukprot:m.71263 g.71263  ORF g.71263 m.71263 type:complete len:321 (-) comp10058_c0_seq3:1639-2601(-)